MITCVSGITIRMSVSSVSEQGRATQGVKLIRVDDGDAFAAITKLDEQEEEVIAPDADLPTDTRISNTTEDTGLEDNDQQSDPPVSE